jgi:hypothetical protein
MKSTGVSETARGFQRTHGYYAHGVGPETAKAPAGWQERLIRVEIPPRGGSQRAAVALCLDPHDLVLAKCVANRERDWEFATEALRHHLVDQDTLFTRVPDLPVSDDLQRHVRSRLEAIVLRLVGRVAPADTS